MVSRGMGGTTVMALLKFMAVLKGHLHSLARSHSDFQSLDGLVKHDTHQAHAHFHVLLERLELRTLFSSKQYDFRENVSCLVQGEYHTTDSIHPLQASSLRAVLFTWWSYAQMQIRQMCNHFSEGVVCKCQLIEAFAQRQQR
jgi:hypothetical protein